MSPVEQEIRALVMEASQSVAASLNGELARDAGGAYRRIYSASIGYSAALLRGVIVVQAREPVWIEILRNAFSIEVTYPLDPAQLGDAACEVANMVAGALKRCLTPRGVDLSVGLPSGTSGVNLTHSPPLSTWWVLETSGGQLEVATNVAVYPGLELADEEVAPLETTGDLLLL